MGRGEEAKERTARRKEIRQKKRIYKVGTVLEGETHFFVSERLRSGSPMGDGHVRGRRGLTFEFNLVYFCFLASPFNESCSAFIYPFFIFSRSYTCQCL
jgi:hypothetical protein